MVFRDRIFVEMTWLYVLTFEQRARMNTTDLKFDRRVFCEVFACLAGKPL